MSRLKLTEPCGDSKRANTLNSGVIARKGKWQYAWDFVVRDNDGKTFHHTGEQRTDYYTYHLPILAPADGTVVKVVESVAENEIGFINAQENWGNFVILRHADNVYSVLAHLAPHTIRVQEGAYIVRGGIVGLCGNSGRSSVFSSRMISDGCGSRATFF